MTKPQPVKCHIYVKRPKAAVTQTWAVPDLCSAYKWPANSAGGGTIAIVELGGGWVQSDVTAFFNSIRQPVPQITDVSVGGVTNSQQNPKNDADVEVALDIQVAGAAYFAATGKPANIRVYWANDIAPGVQAAMKDGCAVCSISWGADEAQWGDTALAQMDAAAAAAAAAGMVVFAAAGDNDSSDGGPGAANVDAPASCPHVVGCGGTRKTNTSETVWNDNPGKTNGEGTGGGYSVFFPVQSWQIGAPPAPTKEKGAKSPGRGRMVPDVAANADPNTGYDIIVYGASEVVGGTSAVAPLYAGLFAAIGASGFVNPTLWAIPKGQSCFTDITVGSNGEFSAAKGPDPCTGLGSPIGTALASLFKSAAAKPVTAT